MTISDSIGKYIDIELATIYYMLQRPQQKQFLMLAFSNLNLFVPLIKLAKPRSAETGHAH